MRTDHSVTAPDPAMPVGNLMTLQEISTAVGLSWNSMQDARNSRVPTQNPFPPPWGYVSVIPVWTRQQVKAWLTRRAELGPLTAGPAGARTAQRWKDLDAAFTA